MIICIDSDGELQDIIEDEISSSSNVHGIVERRPYEQNQKGIATVICKVKNFVTIGVHKCKTLSTSERIYISALWLV